MKLALKAAWELKQDVGITVDVGFFWQRTVEKARERMKLVKSIASNFPQLDIGYSFQKKNLGFAEASEATNTSGIQQQVNSWMDWSFKVAK